MVGQATKVQGVPPASFEEGTGKTGELGMDAESQLWKGASKRQIVSVVPSSETFFLGGRGAEAFALGPSDGTQLQG